MALVTNLRADLLAELGKNMARNRKRIDTER